MGSFLVYNSQISPAEARIMIESGAVPSINIVAQNSYKSGAGISSPANFARLGLSRLTDMFSPLPSRKSYSVGDDCRIFIYFYDVISD